MAPRQRQSNSNRTITSDNAMSGSSRSNVTADKSGGINGRKNLCHTSPLSSAYSTISCSSSEQLQDDSQSTRHAEAAAGTAAGTAVLTAAAAAHQHQQDDPEESPHHHHHHHHLNSFNPPPRPPQISAEGAEDMQPIMEPSTRRREAAHYYEDTEAASSAVRRPQHQNEEELGADNHHQSEEVHPDHQTEEMHANLQAEEVHPDHPTEEIHSNIQTEELHLQHQAEAVAIRHRHTEESITHHLETEALNHRHHHQHQHQHPTREALYHSPHDQQQQPPSASVAALPARDDAPNNSWASHSDSHSSNSGFAVLVPSLAAAARASTSTREAEDCQRQNVGYESSFTHNSSISSLTTFPQHLNNNGGGGVATLDSSMSSMPSFPEHMGNIAFGIPAEEVADEGKAAYDQQDEDAKQPAVSSLKRRSKAVEASDDHPSGNFNDGHRRRRWKLDENDTPHGWRQNGGFSQNNNARQKRTDSLRSVASKSSASTACDRQRRTDSLRSMETTSTYGESGEGIAELRQSNTNNQVANPLDDYAAVPARPELKRGTSDTAALESFRQKRCDSLRSISNHTPRISNRGPPPGRRRGMVRTHSQPVISASRPHQPPPRNNDDDLSVASWTRSGTRQSKPSSTTTGVGGNANATSLGGGPVRNSGFTPTPLKRQSSMTSRVNKLRRSASCRAKRLIGRSKSDLHRSSAGNSLDFVNSVTRSRPESEEEGDGNLQPNNKKDGLKKKSRSLTSSPVGSVQSDDSDTARRRRREDELRSASLPTTSFQRAVTSSVLKKHRRQQTAGSDGNISNHSERRHSGDWTSEDDSGGEDVLLLIAKARAKLAMEGNDEADAEAQAVLAQFTEQQSREEKEQAKLTSTVSGSSVQSGVRSTASSVGNSIANSLGAASMPGAYEKVPGGGFERKESFSHASITRNSISAQMRQQSSHKKESPKSQSSFNSDLDSISSTDSDNMSDIMEIEFSQQSISNHDEEDDEDEKKPPAKPDKEMMEQNYMSAGSVCHSLTNSLHMEDLFGIEEEDSDEKKPPARRSWEKQKGTSDTPSARGGAIERSQSLAGRPNLTSDRSLHTSFASFASIPESIPESAAAASAPTTMSDDDSDSSSLARRRRRRHRSGKRSMGSSRRYTTPTDQEGDHRRRRGHDKRGEEKKLTKPMKDGSMKDNSMKESSMKDNSNSSGTGQLVIAAEVVRTEEEMVQELRQKVEKEILESMAKELNEMEASMSAFSSYTNDNFSQDRSQAVSVDNMSIATADPSFPSPRRRGRRSGRIPLSGRRGHLLRRATSERGLGPPSPMSRSLQVTPSRRGRVAQETPTQNRRLRNMNLTRSSPRLLLPTRGRSLKQQQLPGQHGRPGGMPQIQTSSSGDSSSDDSSTSSSDDSSSQVRRRSYRSELRRHRSMDIRSMDIVDALDVVPASPPAPVRAQSQSNLLARPSLVNMPGQFRSGSLLDQLRSMTNAGAAAAAAAGAATAGSTATATPSPTNLRRGMSQEGSLPDLAPPPLTERPSDQSVLIANANPALRDSPNQNSLSISQLQQARPRTPTHSSSVGSIQHAGSDDTGGGSSFYPDDRNTTEYHVVDTRGEVYVDVPPIPADWNLRQLELAELGRGGGQPMLREHSSLTAAASNVQVDTLGVDTDGRQAPYSSTLITFDNRMPTAWVTPVSLLVIGALILALVLFAI